VGVKGIRGHQCATPRNSCGVFSLLHDFLPAFVLPLHLKGSARGDAVRDGSKNLPMRGSRAQCWSKLLAGHVGAVGAATAGWTCNPVRSHGGDLQQRSCSNVGGKCALLGGGESCRKVLWYAEATLQFGGGALREDHDK